MDKTGGHLDKALTPFMLWGLGVGYVISGMYFGWNLGLEQGGTLGMAIATGFITLMYITFTFSYAELACAIPKAGGGFDYAFTAFGPNIGFIAGWAQTIEFIFAPPAIAFAIGAYLNAFVPGISVVGCAVVVYVLFTALNIYGVKAAATFETIITLFAVAELLLFASLTLPHFNLANLQHNHFPAGWGGVMAAIPFAIWFFLGIEGVANVAEETQNPQRHIIIGFGSAIATLVVLCALVFTASAGVAGWEAIVYKNGTGGETSDSPLPLALAHITGSNHLMYHLLITIGLFGLVASFHGLLLAAGRSTYEMGKARNLPAALGIISPRFHTPANALLTNMAIGILALLTGKTGQIIIISVFGALTLYVVSMLALLQLRRQKPHMHRPFRTPFYPWFPLTALFIATFSLLAMCWYNPMLALIYAGAMVVPFILYRIAKHTRQIIP
ncbi:ethanolamine permease [Sphingobacteriales bacterium UPWRP_1]|nr:ethanolamine permease [Sphingobacteriales bacterium TSM_CSM]PSJ75700.1 ethanolamine permease [Sphingobacteriales bacterium UPWRP_1]